MITRFWKGLAGFDQGMEAAFAREFRRGISGSARTRKFFYTVKPLIPRFLQLYLRRQKAASVDPHLPTGIEKKLCKPVIDLVRTTGRDFHFIWFWPGSSKLACVITHDVETAEGYRRVLRLAEVDERHKVRSAFNFVCENYAIDNGVIRELKARDFEIGIHGVKHDGKLFFSNRIFGERLKKMEHYAREWGAAGFRSPSLLRQECMLEALPFEWDSSIPDSDPYGPQPGGCRTVFPFFLSGRTVELPVTMMQDHTLFEILQKDNTDLWRSKYDYISDLGGMVNLIVHPDYVFSGNRLALYESFLDLVHFRADVWHAKPGDVARWWKKRDQSGIVSGADGVIAVVGPASDRARIASWHQIAENWQRVLHY